MLENDQLGLVQEPLHTCSHRRSAIQAISHREGDHTGLSVVYCSIQSSDGPTVDGDEVKEARSQC